MQGPGPCPLHDVRADSIARELAIHGLKEKDRVGVES